LDHQNVRALFRAAHARSNRTTAIPHVELISATISKLRRRISRVTKRAVEIARELCAVTHHRRQVEPARIEGGANAPDATVHHVARTDAVSAGCGERDCGIRQLIQSLIDLDSLFVQHCAMSVRRVRTETGVDPQTDTAS